jgi:hypothetical protein
MCRWLESCYAYFDEEYIYSDREGQLYNTVTYRFSKDIQLSLQKGDLFKLMLTEKGNESTCSSGIEAYGRVIGFDCGSFNAVKY